MVDTIWPNLCQVVEEQDVGLVAAWVQGFNVAIYGEGEPDDARKSARALIEELVGIILFCFSITPTQVLLNKSIEVKGSFNSLFNVLRHFMISANSSSRKISSLLLKYL